MYSLFFLILFKPNEASKKDDDIDDEEDYSPDRGRGNEGESDEDDISSLIDNSSFLNNKSKAIKASARVPDIIKNMPKANNNTSAMTEYFARMNMGSDDFSIEFRAPFIQYGYIENNQEYIDIVFLVMPLPKKMFSPEVKNGGKGFESGNVCPKWLSNKLRLTSTKDVHNNSNQVTSFKEVSD